MSTRIYRIDITVDTESPPLIGPFLVRAKTRAQALSAVIDPLVRIDVASQDDLLQLVADGTPVIDASTGLPS